MLHRNGSLIGMISPDSIPDGPSILEVGDSTGGTNARADVTRYDFTQCFVAVPAADAWAVSTIVILLMVTGLCVLRRKVDARG
jgi:hypothetical protein